LLQTGGIKDKNFDFRIEAEYLDFPERESSRPLDTNIPRVPSAGRFLYASFKRKNTDSRAFLIAPRRNRFTVPLLYRKRCFVFDAFGGACLFFNDVFVRY
jgi:hypothetical protein